MRFIFKCGNCNHKYYIDIERVKNSSFCNYCPNCASRIPTDIKNFAQSISNLDKNPDAEKWQIYVIPDKLIKDEPLLTSIEE